jgi:hypothetical protein
MISETTREQDDFRGYILDWDDQPPISLRQVSVSVHHQNSYRDPPIDGEA